MLILTRKPGQAIRIGDDLIIRVKAVRGRQVRLGIEAPREVPVYREEIYEGRDKADERDGDVSADAVRALLDDDEALNEERGVDEIDALQPDEITAS